MESISSQRNLANGELLGIAVRGAASSEQRVSIPREELEDARTACIGFGATPSFAFASSDASETWLFVVGGERLAGMSGARSDGIDWSFSRAAMDGYLEDPTIMSIKVSYEALRWWQTSS